MIIVALGAHLMYVFCIMSYIAFIHIMHPLLVIGVTDAAKCVCCYSYVYFVFQYLLVYGCMPDSVLFGLVYTVPC